MKFLILLLILLSISCKKQNSFQGKAKPVFRLDSFSTNYNEKETYFRRKELLHLVYSKLVNDDANKLFSIEKLSEININHKTSIEHDLNYARLVVSYPDHEELFYIPIESTKDWLLNNLNLKRSNSFQPIFIGANFQKNETSYLLITNKEEVLANEIHFQNKELHFENVTKINLEQISKFQSLNLKLSAVKNQLVLKESKGRQVFPGKCFVPRRVVIGGEGGGGRDIPVPCTCEYKIFKPVLSSDLFEDVDLSEVIHRIVVNNENLEVKGAEFEISLKNENQLNSFAIDFFNEEYVNQKVKGIKMSEYCTRDPEENVNIKEEYHYNVEVNVLGTSLQIDQIINLPKEIE